jgi:prolyl-tRNA editing enzyme YbaK/EbsC (Cys-tRNA(Pro) deacylase)
VLRATPRATPTVEASALALGVPPERVRACCFLLTQTATCAEATLWPFRVPHVRLPRHHQVLKSLVFAAGDDFIIVVVSGSGRVDARKLASLLGVKRTALRLAPPLAAAAVTGYAIGTIPPLGHATRLRTVLDAAVLAAGPDAVLFAGGGGAATQLEISAAELLRACAAEVGDVLQGRAPEAAATMAAAAAAAFPEEGLLGAYAALMPRSSAAASLDQRVAPARPLRAAVAAVLGAPPAGSGGAAVELVVLEATVVRVRRMGRLLLFASLAPHVPAGDAGGAAVSVASAALPAALASADGAPAALQAIAGRTLAAALGEDAAAALLSGVRAGVRVRITGRPQANPRPGCVDIVVAELAVLDAAPASAPSAFSAAPPATVDALPDADEADAKDPDAWLFADGEDDEEDDADDDADDELMQYANACGDGLDASSSDAGAAGPIAWASSSSSSRRRSSPRRGGFAAPLAPLHAFALPAGITVVIIATAADVAVMSASVCDPFSDTHAPVVDATVSVDATPLPPLPAVVGIDAEWRPYERGGTATPVALLQLATRRAVFLVDVLALSGATDGLPALDAFLRELLPSDKVLKLGFGLQHDLSRLASSYDNSLTFGASAPPRSLLELRGAAAVAAPDALPWLPHPRRLAGVGLASLTRLVLRAELDKRAQMSDWGARPLTDAQAAYAAADASVLCALFDSLMARSAKLRSKLPFLLDAPPGRAVFGAPARGGSAGRGSSARGAPPRGDKVALGELCVSVEGLLSNFLGVPLPGKGRDAALAAASACAPDGGRPRGAGGCRGGVLECANAALLFMNAEPVAGKRYPNEFWRRARDGALMVSWFGGPGQHEGTPQVARLMGGQSDDGVLLFVRMPRGPYVCCGRLVCEGTGDADDGDAAPAGRASAKGLLRLRMRLLDAASLCGSAHFASLLAHAQGDAGLALLARR